MIWNFLNTGFNHGEFNMELDLQLVSALRERAGIPTLRMYGWSPPAISIGAHQHIEDFDAGKLEAADIDIVRRPTGGRAILHANELTYSVVMKTDGQSLRDAYRFVNEGLLCGLRVLGIDAELADRSDDFRRLYKDPSSIPCFTSFAKCEIHHQGKKLVGSAQRRYGGTILQHGSLLLGPQHRRIVEFLSEDVRGPKSVIEEQLNSCTSDAQTILGRIVTFEEAAECMKEGFRLGCGVEFIEEDVTLPALFLQH